MAVFDNSSIARYLNDSENALPSLLTATHRPSFVGMSSLPRQYAHGTCNAPTCSIISEESASASPTGESDESVFSAKSYKSTTTATSRQSAQINPTVGWRLQAPSTPQINTTVVLPCEFLWADCHVEFHPDNFENWLAHTLTHFANLPPPSKCVCLFCDDEVFEDNDDPRNNWRQRMIHNREHFIDGETNIRPDFLVIDYMWKNGLITDKDYRSAEQYTERPSVLGLVRKGFETPEAKLKRERESKVPHNLHKEERDRKRSSHTHKEKERQSSISSRKHRPVSIKNPSSIQNALEFSRLSPA
ncbi:hypothetical protein NHQ30_007546 [Ciborinia camelliae]|nr:hypothetical protein NHQ30_007546 [Ciborinia camelliae]